MSFGDAVTIEIGAAIAKSILKLWVKDSTLGGDISSNLIDLFKAKTSDILAQHKGNRQFETIGERVGESLLPLFNIEGAHLEEGDRIAVALAVAEALHDAKISSELLVKHNLEPTRLARYILSSTSSTVTSLFSSIELAFYQRIIEECCVYIVDIASQLPSFTQESFAKILKEDEQLIITAKKIISELQQIREQLNPMIEAELFEKDYREAVKRNLDRVQLIGMDATSSSRHYRLSVAYISLTITWNASVREHKKNLPKAANHNIRTTQENFERETISVNDFLALSRHLLIRGAAGSGKTTLLRWIAVKSATRSFGGTLADWNKSVPFFILLRHCTQSHLPKPENFPELVSPAIAGKMPPKWVHTLLAAGRGLVLIDGVDEISVQKREEVLKWLNDLIETFPLSRFIITSRPTAIEKGWLRHQDFYDAELEPMGFADISMFIEQWHQAMQEELHDDEEKAALIPLSEHLKQEVRRNRSLRNLATNPLMCSMLCIFNQGYRGQLPADRIELYEACCYLLLERRDIVRGVDLSDYPVLSYRQKCLLLESFAYWMIKNDQVEVPLQVADEYFAHKLINMAHISSDVKGLDICRFYIERAGIIREPAVGYLDFTHRTFQEYLAAKAAAHELDTGILTENAQNDQWQEVIVLASGIASRQMREELIRNLIKRGDKERDKRYQLHLLAVLCLETSLELDINVRAEVEARLSQLVPPKNMTDARALAAAGEMAIKYLPRGRKLSTTVVSACIRALSIIGGEAALEQLESYITDSRGAVINELFRSWDSFDEKMYVKRILLPIIHDGENFHFEHISSLNGFQYLTNVTALDLSLNLQISDLSPLAGLTQLAKLNLQGCSQISDLSPLAGLTHVTDLNLRNCSQISDLSPLAGLTQLTKLNLQSCSQISDLSPLAGLTQLKTLNLTSCKQVKDLNFLYSMVSLEEVNLTGCSQINDFSPLERLSGLKFLNLSYCEQFSDLGFLENLIQIQWLELPICKQVQDLSPLANLTQIKTLTMPYCSQVQDLSPLANLTQIETLAMPYCSQVQDLSPLANLTQIKTLNLSYCVQIDDLSPLSKLIKLASLDLSVCGNVKDIHPLSQLKHLLKLEMKYCDQLNDVSPIANLRRLRSLDLSGCKKISNVDTLKQLNKLHVVTK